MAHPWTKAGLAAVVALLALKSAVRAEETPAPQEISQATAKSLLAQADGKEAPYACFIRRYDNAHLASHPKQNVRSMAMFVWRTNPGEEESPQYSLSMRVTFRQTKGAFDLGGGCKPDPDHPGKLNCGFECDGGHVDVRQKDDKSVLVDIPNGGGSVEMDEAGKHARFNSDDKLFRLDRTSAKDCLPIVWVDELKEKIEKGK